MTLKGEEVAPDIEVSQKCHTPSISTPKSTRLKQEQIKNQNKRVTDVSTEKIVTDVPLYNFIKKCYEPGSQKDIVGSDSIYSKCVEFYKNTNEKFPSKANFTRFFKTSWNLIYPNTSLETSDKIRDPNNSKKRGIAFIKEKK